MFSNPLRAAMSCATSLSMLRWNRTRKELVKTLLADDATNVVDPSKKYSHPNNIALRIECSKERRVVFSRLASFDTVSIMMR